MILITGPLYSGKRSCARQLLHCSEEEFSRRVVCNAQERAADSADLTALANELTRYEIVIATEVGGGIVPIDPVEREAREAAGRLSCLLAERADTVIRVFCGIPMLLKGEWDG